MTPTVLDTDATMRLARELLAAERAAVPVEPLTRRLPDLTVRDAYEIQRQGRRLRVAGGAALVGRKVGLTSAAMQEMLGVGQPDLGYLTDAMALPPGGTVALDELIAPRVEAEIAFRLGRRLEGPDVTLEEVLAATEAVAPALEIIDSRVAEWRIAIADTIADNASCGRFVVGEAVPPDGLDLAATAVELTVLGDAGAERVEGAGEAVLGHPAEAVAWLARALDEFDEAIEPGEVVLPGAVARALPFGPGNVIRASFAGLGELRMDVGVTRCA